MISNLSFLVKFDFKTFQHFGGHVQVTLPFDERGFRIVLNKQSMKEVDSECYPFAIMFKNEVGQWLPVEYGNLSYVEALDFAHLWIEGLNSFVGIGDNETVLGELVGRTESYIGLR